MSAEAMFQAVLANDPQVAELVAGRIALNAVPPDVALPYIVFGASHDPQQLLDGVAEDKVTFNVECWAKTATAAIALADRVQTAVEAYDATTTDGLSVTVLDRQGVYDPDLQLDGVTLTVEWWP